MSTHNASSSGRRSGRGGRRNRGRDGDSRSYNPQPSAPAPVEKPTLIQRILSIFRPKKAAPPAQNSSRPREAQGKSTVTSSYPTRAESPRAESPRQPRENRNADAPAANPAYSRPARKPEAIEVTTPKIYVGNLSFDATESDLSELFAGVGQVQTAEIVAHKQTEKSKGFAFVTMTSVDEAKRAVTELHDKEFMGRKLVVSGAKTPIERS